MPGTVAEEMVAEEAAETADNPGDDLTRPKGRRLECPVVCANGGFEGVTGGAAGTA